MFELDEPYVGKEELNYLKQAIKLVGSVQWDLLLKNLKRNLQNILG